MNPPEFKTLDDGSEGCYCKFMGGYLLSPDGEKWWSEELVARLEKRIQELEQKLGPSKEMLDCMAAFDKVEAAQKNNDRIIHLLKALEAE